MPGLLRSRANTTARGDYGPFEQGVVGSLDNATNFVEFESTSYRKMTTFRIFR